MELKAQKVTIYRKSEFSIGYHKMECRKFAFARRQWAQYPNAIEIAYVGKGKRKASWFVESSYPSCVVLEGHGHPDAPSPWTAPIETENGCMVRSGKYASCDPRWAEDFDAMINAYIAESGAKVVLDTRGNNPYQRQTA
jgi:hypothetical protein